MAVREPLEVVFEPPRALRFRPPLSSLLPLADAAALGSVCLFVALGPISLIGFRPIGIVFAVLTFLILNSDSTLRSASRRRFWSIRRSGSDRLDSWDVRGTARRSFRSSGIAENSIMSFRSTM